MKADAYRTEKESIAPADAYLDHLLGYDLEDAAEILRDKE